MNRDTTRNALVCAISTADSAHWVVARAAEIASHHPGTCLHILHVVERRLRRSPTDDVLDEAMTELRARTGRIMADLADLWQGRDTTCTLHLRCGEPAEEIAMLAAEVEADVILVGARSDRSHHVPGELLDLAECRVEVVRPKDYGSDVAPVASEERRRRESDTLPLSAVLRPTSHISSTPTQFG